MEHKLLHHHGGAAFRVDNAAASRIVDYIRTAAPEGLHKVNEILSSTHQSRKKARRGGQSITADSDQILGIQPTNRRTVAASFHLPSVPALRPLLVWNSFNDGEISRLQRFQPESRTGRKRRHEITSSSSISGK